MYEQLKTAVKAVIKANGNEQITGDVLQSTILSLINSLGANPGFAGVATPTLNPGTPDENVFYLASQAGTYQYFNNYVITEGKTVIFSNKTGSFVGSLFLDLSLKADKTELSKKADLLPTKNLFDKSTVTDGFFLHPPTASAAFCYSDYISVLPNTNYVQSNFNQGGAKHAYYDINKVYISMTDTAIMTTPANCYFVRLSCAIANKNVSQFELGTVATAYEAFGAKIPKSQIDFADYRLKSDIINNLTSESETSPVSAKQAKILNDGLALKASLVQGKNLFNKAVTLDGYYLGDTNGLVASATFAVSDYIPVIAGQQYVATKSMRFTTFFNSAKQYIAGGNNNPSTLTTIPAGVSFIRFTLNLSNKDTQQFEAGAVATFYAPYTLKMPFSQLEVITDGLIAKTNTDKPVSGKQIFEALELKPDLIIAKNLFDKSTVTDGFFLHPPTANATYCYSDYISVLPSTNYVQSNFNQGGAKHAYYDINKTYISMVDSTAIMTTPANCYFVRLSCNISNKNVAQFELGTVATAYETFGKFIKESQIPITIARVQDFYNKTQIDSLQNSGRLKAEYLADYMQFINYGQSLSVGGSMSQAIDFYDSKTFAGGILTNYDPADTTAKNAYYSTGFISLPATGAETQAKGQIKTLKDLILNENGIAIANQNYTCVVNAPGAGGISYSACASKTGIYYTRLIESIKYGVDFALALGKSYNVPVVNYVQGENTGDAVKSELQWYNDLDALFISLNTDIKAITKQTNDVQFINYQIASYTPTEGGNENRALAVLKLSKDRVNVHFGCAMYQRVYTDLYHVGGTETRLMGANFGVVAKRILIDKVKMLPITPVSWVIQSNQLNTIWCIIIKMEVPVKPLVFDETVNAQYVEQPTNKGFSILSGANEIITSVKISNGDTLNIFCNENPTGKNLTYAIGGKYKGGNLRDSQGDKITILCEGVTKRVDNWAPIFKQTI